jgi:hypothetical protein
VSADDLRPPGREILDIARRARTPSNEDRERVHRALVASLGGAAAVGAAKVASAAASMAPKASLGWLKWAVPVALLSSASIGTYVWSVKRHVPPPVSTAPALENATQEPSPAPSPTVALSEPSPFAEPAPAPATVTPPKGATTRPPTKAQTESGGDALAQELSLLHQAHAEWRSGNAAHALALAREHAHRFPNSQLRFERNALEVRALCALGREAEARKAADQLRSQAPNSPVSAALKDTCVGK